MPAQPLTTALVAALEAPSAGQRLVWDTRLSGFGVRLTPGGKRVYVAQGRASGRTVRVSIGRTDHLSCEQARNLARARLGEMASGKDVNRERRVARVQTVSLKTAFDAFRKGRSANKPRTLHEYQRQLDSYLSDWLDKPWASVTRTMVAERHRQIGEANGRRTANNVARMLRSLLNFCRATYRHPTTDTPLTAENPVKVLSDTKAWFKEAPRDDHLKPSQIGPWWRAVEKHANSTQRDYLLTLLLTGCRANEIAPLRWKSVDLDNGVLTIEHTKNGSVHRLPISPVLRSLFQARRGDASTEAFVFPASSKRPSLKGHVSCANRVLDRIAKSAGVSMRSRHGLRRTFASVGEQLGIGTFTLKRLMNHQSGTHADITYQYAQLSVEALREPATRISAFIKKCADENPTSNVVQFPNAAASA